ncbi:hypothetical protein OIV83_006047 [Microbotryomycetes sp. JL201]|nr:hypothetical protein OIV83_006047 [Microbotryomycetes sp. JL201]
MRASINLWTPSFLDGADMVEAGDADDKAVQTDLARRWPVRDPRSTSGLENIQGFTKAARRKRQLPVAEGYPDCNFVGNGVLSCFPTSDTILIDDVWSKFIWNAQFPTFIGAGRVDIYLYRADSETVAEQWLGIENARGMIAIRPDDQWWPQNQTSWTQGQNLTFPFYFVIVDAGTTLSGGETHQSTFSAVQTAAPSTLIASLSSLSASSASVASSRSSVASVMSVSSASSASAARETATNALQTGKNDSDGGAAIPDWAIAIIVVLGFLALLTAAILAYLCMRRMRRRRRRGDGGLSDEDLASGQDSREPMMASGPGQRAVGQSQASPGVAASAGGLAAAGAARPRDSDASSKMPPATASSIAGSDGPITTNDAAFMAEAFRKALRKPEFGGDDGVDGSPDSTPSAEGAQPELVRDSTTPSGGEILDNELRSEGRTMQTVTREHKWGT